MTPNHHTTTVTAPTRTGWARRLAGAASATLIALSGLAVGLTDGIGGPRAEAAGSVAAGSAVTDATFSWGLNSEAGSGAYFGGCNFLSAGVAGSTGSSRVWTKADGFYSARSGNTRIEKAGSTGYQPATWETKCQNAGGATVTVANNSTSANRAIIEGGSGTVDAAANTADVSWQGSFTVAFYGGMTYWSISNPVLTVNADGTGTLTATGSGFGADMDDPGKWTTLPGRTVTLATLTDVVVGAAGISALPDYLGVTVDTGDGVPQSPASAANANYHGSFPQSFVDFQIATGQAAYWYTSGGARDQAKVASALEIGYTATPTTSSAATTSAATTAPGTTEPGTTAPGTTAPGTSAPGTTASGTTAPVGGKRTISNGTLNWGINHESNSAAFFGGCNFLVAGKVKDVGSSHVWSAAENLYAATAGNVAVVKPDAGGNPVTPTWATKCQAADGTTVTTGNNKATGSTLVLSKGTGWAEPSTNQAKIRWAGSFTVVYYGGLTYWSAANPVLTVGRDGTATLTATASGFGADMDDPTVWTTISPRTITLAVLRGVTVGATGFTVTPQYLGVATTVAADGPSVPQVARTSANQAFWGSFPQDFVNFQVATGQAAYWYTSGGQRDPAKPALPVAVGWTLGAVIDRPDVTVPTVPTGATTADSPAVTSTITEPAVTVTRDPEEPAAVPDDEFAVDNAQLRWGFNNESNNRAFAPGTVNFFSAGKVASVGPAKQVTQDRWRGADGNVSIEKRSVDGSYRAATWAGLSTTATGATLGAPSAGTFSDHQVVIDGGVGTIDPRTNTGTISWQGDFTVVYYSGLTFYYVSDPVLTVRADGRAQLTATLGGFGSDMNDATIWEPLADQKNVVLADLAGVDLASAAGFTVTPEYAEVRYRSASGVAQKTDTPYFGAFPQSFVEYQTRTGQAAYWYSSGGATDKFKFPLPITVSYSATEPVTPTTTGAGADGTPSPTATGAPGNGLNLPPTLRQPPAPTGATAPAKTTRPAGSGSAEPSGTVAPTAAGTVVAVAVGAGQPVAVPAAAPTGIMQIAGGANGFTLVAQSVPLPPQVSSGSDDRLLWAGGGVLLVLAAVCGSYAGGIRLTRRS